MARRGGRIVDGDRIGHEVLEQPAVKHGLVARWGPRILKPEGTVNRRAIAGIVFGDPVELRALEELAFPEIGRRAREEIRNARADPLARFVVLDAAVMMEAGWSEDCDRIVYVDAPREIRLARLAARSGWQQDEVAAREATQLPADAKRARSDAVLSNDGTTDVLQDRVDRLLTEWGLML
jgi:dephospho-CoA kinase